MPKPISITTEMKEKAQDEFTEFLSDLKMSDGKINYSKTFRYEESTATLWLTQHAYSKIVALVTAFPDEVAWHGTVDRKGKCEFIIEDIFVYPQEVTSSTVITDQERYTKWLYDFDDSDFNRLRMQGHSHVNMSVFPSGVDSSHREMILNQLGSDMFYIFMIWNKALKIHTMIYDIANNILYEDDDISIKIVGDDSLDSFIIDAREKVQRRKPKTYRIKRSRNSELEQENLKWDWYDSYGMYFPYEL